MKDYEDQNQLDKDDMQITILNPRTGWMGHVKGNLSWFSYETKDELDFKQLLAHRCLTLVKNTTQLSAKVARRAHAAMVLFMHHEPKEAVRLYPGCERDYYYKLQTGLKVAKRLSVDDALCQEYMRNIRRFRHAEN
jgi:hypothetical protein